ncbi:DNA-binding response regulator [Thalassobaculum fulvum]|jgi:DNA-binding response OmpR family regulator|uniref:DNA-binding response regulator n=1 Tax=Thalassobaculum fulvum TaxID=1633335 RepID=A0A918XNV5_9PROT|nr:response regulator transcription factor [Thalassobaculum fulvum]GHD43086.1 DNA-binding response regulator [Thalassobaculum fulvum]
MTKTIAIVEDERPIAEMIARTLEEHGFKVECYGAGEPFLAALQRKAPSLCVMDLGLPDMDGIGLLQRIREIAPLPVIILSARQHPSDRIVGLELGADDFVIKPFDPREVVARVRSVLRRAEAGPRSPGRAVAVAHFAGWRFDAGALALTAPDGNPVELGAGEARLMQTFLEAPQRVLSRDFLLTKAGSEDSFDRSIDVRVSRLRKKLQGAGDADRKPLIRTVYGAGYLLTCPVVWEEA